ncbi:DUF1016 family protein [bacterium]|nr:DUF1016 family protein [bacterium]
MTFPGLFTNPLLMTLSNTLSVDYQNFLKELKQQIRQAQLRAGENGWSRNVMVHQIESGLYHRQGQAMTNFPETLPAPQSELAQQLLKDPYTFDFLTIEEKAKERELEKNLLLHLRDFLIELGRGFAFLGSQYPVTVGQKDYAIDLLFYNVRLHCYIVIELKMDEFKQEYAGKIHPVRYLKAA